MKIEIGRSIKQKEGFQAFVSNPFPPKALAKRESESGVLVLSHLFVGTGKVVEWTGFTRAGAQRVIDRFVKLGILEPQEEKGTYDRSYIYRRYADIFLK